MLTGVILAGGKDDNINGTLKSFLPLNKKRVLDYQIKEMKKLCKEIVIVTNTPPLFLSSVSSDIRIITDFHKDKGVLGGMFSALSLSTHPYLWIVGSGMPFISSKAAKYMSSMLENSEYHAILPYVKGETYPLHGIYSKGLLPTFEDLKWSSDYNDAFHFIEQTSYLGISEQMFLKNRISPSFIYSIKNEDDYRLAIAMKENRS